MFCPLALPGTMRRTLPKPAAACSGERPRSGRRYLDEARRRSRCPSQLRAPPTQRCRTHSLLRREFPRCQLTPPPPLHSLRPLLPRLSFHPSRSTWSSASQATRFVGRVRLSLQPAPLLQSLAPLPAPRRTRLQSPTHLCHARRTPTATPCGCLSEPDT